MRALAVNARIEQAILTDDGLETVREWEHLITVSGTLTPISLEQVTRLGLKPDEATHQLVLGNGLPFTPSSWRVVVADRVYDLQRATNLPTKTILVLRSTTNTSGGGESS